MPKQTSESEKVVLEAQVRTPGGKGVANSLRHHGLIPGVVYGEGDPPVVVQVKVRDLGQILHTKRGGNVLISLRTGSDERMVLIKELQHHPVSHQVTHVDFHHVSLTKRITVAVPLAFKGEAAGVKTGGGILEHLRWDLEVECLPTQIPSEIPVDVSGLELDQVITAKAVRMPEGVRLVTDPQLPVVACVIPKEEPVSVPAAEAAAEVTEPEVIKQKKPEEVEAAAAEEKGEKQEKPPKPEPKREEKK